MAGWLAILLVVGALILLVGSAVSVALWAVGNRSGPSRNPQDLAAGTGSFGQPVYVANTFQDFSLFGNWSFVHPSGYLAAVMQSTTDQSLAVAFYSCGPDGTPNLTPQVVSLDFLPATYLVCSGAFFPTFGYLNEVYYLAISVGPSFSNPATAQTPAGTGTMSLTCPVCVLMFSFDTSQTTPTWQLASVQSDYTTSFTSGNTTVTGLALPVPNFTYDATSVSTGTVGTFGNYIQAVLDDTTSPYKQSLYVSGSEYSVDFPGGSVFWFVLTNNSANPTVKLVAQVQDAKLLMLRQAYLGGTLTTTPYSKTTSDYVNGFGASFYVTSGYGSNNLLIVSNNTAEDYAQLPGVAQPAAPYGYVQGYTIDTATGTWVQSTTTTDVFDYRYIADGDNGLGDGFGYGVSWFNNSLVVGYGTTPSANSKVGQFTAYAWAKTPPRDSGTDRLVALGTMNPNTSSSTFVETPVWPTAYVAATYTMRQNVQIQPLGDSNMIFCTAPIYTAATGNPVTIQQAVGTGKGGLNTAFTTVQNIGYLTGATRAASGYSDRSGYAQSVGSFISSDETNVVLVMSDPFSNGGRLAIYAKTRATS